MKLFFDHIAGNVNTRELVYSPATAVFEEDEYEFAIENGWHIAESWGVDDFEWYNRIRGSGQQVWYQARSTRIAVSQFEERSRHRKKIKRAGVKCEVLKDITGISHLLWKTYQDYLAKKGFVDMFTKQEDLFRQIYGPRTYLVYRDSQAELIGFSILEVVSSSIAVAPQFAWNYNNPKIGLGSLNKIFQFRFLSDAAISHLYLGNSYELSSLGKKKYPGFEWWNGREWSSDVELYSYLLEKETSMKTLDDLYRIQKEYYSRLR